MARFGSWMDRRTGCEDEIELPAYDPIDHGDVEPMSETTLLVLDACYRARRSEEQDERTEEQRIADQRAYNLKHFGEECPTL